MPPLDVKLTFNEGPLRTLLVEPKGDVGRYLAKQALRVESKAKGTCPVGTPESTGKPGYQGGRLRAGIHWITGQKDMLIAVQIVTDTGAAVTIGDDVTYAYYVHEGTRYMKGRPFLTTALDGL